MKYAFDSIVQRYFCKIKFITNYKTKPRSFINPSQVILCYIPWSYSSWNHFHMKRLNMKTSTTNLNEHFGVNYMTIRKVSCCVPITSCDNTDSIAMKNITSELLLYILCIELVYLTPSQLSRDTIASQSNYHRPSAIDRKLIIIAQDIGICIVYGNYTRRF